MKPGRRKRKTKRRQRDRRAVQAEYMPSSASLRLRDLRRQDHLRRMLKSLSHTTATSVRVRFQAVTVSSPITLRFNVKHAISGRL